MLKFATRQTRKHCFRTTSLHNILYFSNILWRKVPKIVVHESAPPSVWWGRGRGRGRGHPGGAAAAAQAEEGGGVPHQEGGHPHPQARLRGGAWHTRGDIGDNQLPPQLKYLFCSPFVTLQNLLNKHQMLNGTLWSQLLSKWSSLS